MEKNLCRHYSIASRQSHSILNVAKMFDTKIKFYLEEQEKDISLLYQVEIYQTKFINTSGVSS